MSLGMLIATSNLQMLMVPLLVVLAKDKAVAAELAAVISSSHCQQAPTVIIAKHQRAQPFNRITPRSFAGDVTLANLAFYFPTLHAQPCVSRNPDMFLPSRETTLVVGFFWIR